MKDGRPQDWSGIGYDPAPGAQHVVENLADRLAKLAEHLNEVHTIFDDITNGKSHTWHGEAAAAFKGQVGKLPKFLRDAHDSVDEAKRQLRAWHTVLTENQPRAWTLEEQAKRARTALKKAESEHRDASADPDLELDGKTFTNDEARANAQRRLDSAIERCDLVASRLKKAQARLDRILDEAEDLGNDHESVARRRAKNIREAADDHAPPEDGFWKSVGDWFKDNSDWFTVAASVAGVAAMFFPPLAIAAVALSAVALTSHAAKFGASGLKPTKENMGNYLTLGGDMLGVIPGVGAAKAGVTAARGARAGMGTTKAITQGARTAKSTLQTSSSVNGYGTVARTASSRLGMPEAQAAKLARNFEASGTLGLTAPTAANAALEGKNGTIESSANASTAAHNAMAGGAGKFGMLNMAANGAALTAWSG